MLFTFVIDQSDKIITDLETLIFAIENRTSVRKD